MMIGLSIIILSPMIIVLIFDVVFVTEIIAGLNAKPIYLEPGTQRLDLAIVIPANNEAAVIGHTLAALRESAGGDPRILVVADNCSDATADIARDVGVEVVIRTHATECGKGFALAFARDVLRASPPQVVVIIDADCRIDAVSLAQISHAAATLGRAVQAVSLLTPNLAAPPLVQMSNFAFAVKNRLRNAGLQWLTGGALLTGTGMAFPWKLFEQAPLATDNVVEDLALGLDFTASGRSPLLAIEASVLSPASSTAGTLIQRTRWERGFIATSLRRGIPDLGRALRQANPRTLWLALSLLVPPFSLLVLLNLATGLISLALWLGGGDPSLLLTNVIAGLALMSAVGAAWHRVGREYLSPAAAIAMPCYVLWKIPLYFSAFLGTPIKWLRTGR
jgi:cellulose synthase/poly-beta-1,6-N-acetylglucosamine synthase-like glycosyltransferase